MAVLTRGLIVDTIPAIGTDRAIEGSKMSQNHHWTSQAMSLADKLIERANTDLMEWERNGGIGVDPVTRLKTQTTLAGFGLLADAILGGTLDGCDEKSIAKALKDISASARGAAEAMSDAVPEETAGPSF